jgi:hypothetical protein
MIEKDEFSHSEVNDEGSEIGEMKSVPPPAKNSPRKRSWTTAEVRMPYPNPYANPNPNPGNIVSGDSDGIKALTTSKKNRKSKKNNEYNTLKRDKKKKENLKIKVHHRNLLKKKLKRILKVELQGCIRKEEDHLQKEIQMVLVLLNQFLLLD